MYTENEHTKVNVIRVLVVRFKLKMSKLWSF